MKTGYYDRYGRAIREGDRLRATCCDELITGTVREDDGIWYLANDKAGGWSPDLLNLDECEIIREDLT